MISMLSISDLKQNLLPNNSIHEKKDKCIVATIYISINCNLWWQIMRYKDFAMIVPFPLTIFRLIQVK